MTYGEMVTDTTLHLFFFAFGLVAGMFVLWVNDYKERRDAKVVRDMKIEELEARLSYCDEACAADHICSDKRIEELEAKLHDATVKYQYLLMQYEPEKAARMASAAMEGER